MNFDIFLTAWRGGQEAIFDRAIVENAFHLLIGYRDEFGWGLKLPDGAPAGGFVFIDEAPQISNFSVNRPPLAPVFWDALFDVMRRTPTVLIWPGFAPHPRACAARPDMIAELSAEIIVALGVPTLVYSGDEIRTCISLTR